MRRFIIALLVLSFTTMSCSKFVKLQKSRDVIAKYEGAVKYFDKEDYGKSALLLEEILPLLKGRKEGENAQYMFAYCHFHSEQYVGASHQFKKFYQIYRRSEKAEECLYMSSYSLTMKTPAFNLDQTNTKKALVSIQTYLNTYPKSTRVDTCNQIMHDLRLKLEKKSFESAMQHHKRRDYKSAIVVLENFQEEYPDSDLVEEVLFRKLEMHYYLAKNSIERKKIKRYNDAITAHEDFLENYPESKYVKEANEYYDLVIKRIAFLKKEEERRAKEIQENKEKKASINN